MTATASPAPKPRPAVIRVTHAWVHYATSPGTAPACLPGDPPNASRHRKSTADPGLVTCRHCRETPAWQEADLFAGLEAYVTGGAR